MLRSALLAAAAAACAAQTVPASNPGIFYAGRTQINADGSRSFDWEGVQAHANLVGASYLEAVVNGPQGLNRIRTQIFLNGLWVDLTRVFVRASAPSNVYRVADGLQGNSSVRLFFELEPAFTNAGPNSMTTFLGFNTDGTVGPATPLARKMEVLGDSISAGYGSQCSNPPGTGGPVNDWSSSNYGTYNQMLCDYFQANCSIVAWSGKGMYENCCDSGERMPAYYLQTRGGESYSTDWDFTRFVPDALLINLGTNDFGHDAGPAWEANFTATYVQFVLNATQMYYKNPTMPVFLAQGPMNNGQPLYNALQAAIQGITAAGGKAYYLDMRGPPNDGCGGHPGVEGHKGMFNMSAPVIKQVMGW